MTRNRKERYFVLLIIFFYAHLELLVLVSGQVYPSIHWNYENPRFKEGTFRLNVLPNSKLRIVCPHIAISQITRKDLQSNNHLYENFWIVDKSSHASCVVNTSITNNKIMLRCEDPASVRLSYENLVFQSFSAVDVTFVPGKMYYFLSTANGSKESLDSTSKGHCLKFNMKMQIYICKDSQDMHCSQPKPTTPVMAAIDGIRKRTTTSTSTTTKETTTVQQIRTSSTSSPEAFTTQPPLDPSVGALRNEITYESPATKIPLWMSIFAILLGVLLVASLVCNMYFWREIKRRDTLDYNREDSCKPVLIPTKV